MGERLAKEVQAIFRAKFEQLPSWHEGGQQAGSFSDHEVIGLLAETIGALQETVLYIAREIDDPPRLNEP